MQIRTAIMNGGGYTNYAHGKPPKSSKIQIAYVSFLVISIGMTLFINFDSIIFNGTEPEEKQANYKFKFTKLEAASLDSNEAEQKSDEKMKKKSKKVVEENSDIEEEKDQKKKINKKRKKISFRDKKIIQYENRIREYSAPEKVFRYFATLEILNESNESLIFMKPDDFIRSLTFDSPKQPEGLGLDSFQKYDPDVHNLDIKVPEDSVFYLLGQKGLISFSDYIFLLILLSTPIRHFEIAFKMFDLDGNGNIDADEFSHLQTIIRNNTQTGSRHRDTRMTGNVVKENSALNKYFFGNDFKELLTIEKFTKFHQQLQSEMIRMEFLNRDPIDDKISDIDFCENLLDYAGFNQSKIKKMLKRISKTFEDCEEGITLKDYEDFFHVLRSVHDIDTALKFYSLAGASIDKEILKHVAKTVSGVELKEHVVDVVFCLFDENGDGKLSHREFIDVMKKRWLRGLQKPKDTGMYRFLNSFYACAKETVASKYL